MSRGAVEPSIAARARHRTTGARAEEQRPGADEARERSNSPFAKAILAVGRSAVGVALAAVALYLAGAAVACLGQAMTGLQTGRVAGRPCSPS